MSGKIVYTPRGESVHANSRKVRSTWPKVIATESYRAVRILGLRLRVLTPALDSSRSPSASCGELDARLHSLTFTSLRVMYCYVMISVFNQSRPSQRINSLHVIETDAAYRNPRFRSIPLDNYQGWGSRKRNYLLQNVQIITKKRYKFQDY